MQFQKAQEQGWRGKGAESQVSGLSLHKSELTYQTY